MSDYLDDLSERLDALAPPNESFRDVVESLKQAAGSGSAVRDALERAMDALEQSNITEFKDSIKEALAYQETVSSASKDAENTLRGML